MGIGTDPDLKSLHGDPVVAETKKRAATAALKTN
jgi:hypothetical protein